MKRNHWIKILYRIFALGIVLLLPLSRGTVNINQQRQQIRTYTRSIEFDFWNWTIDAALLKMRQSTIAIPQYLDPAQQSEIVRRVSEMTGRIRWLSYQIEQAYANPEIKNPEVVTSSAQQELEQLEALHQVIAPVAESILQAQISTILKEQGLTFLGQPIPPLFYHATPLPKSLIVSPRELIRQDASINLTTDLLLDEAIALENRVASDLNVSTLVTDVGGIGTYPTMVAETGNLSWMIGVVCHEWTHNFLTLRPLGLSYDRSNDLRTMNETTAEIVETELKLEVYRRFYPELVPPPEIEEPPTAPPEQNQPPVFDFPYEMYLTRTHTDELLAEGKVEEAEAYMESRREFLYENGYQIRKLNQAYFAFHSAYVNAPVGSEEGAAGAAGIDPVGPAVWKLREQNATLAGFLNQISWMTSFQALARATATE
ncbi:MAG: hypothetical protein JW750_10120 [Anaerolineaceae bacterium]|nr:hypothetical protein [Anaerolineaceae bacterium]